VKRCRYCRNLWPVDRYRCASCGAGLEYPEAAPVLEAVDALLDYETAVDEEGADVAAYLGGRKWASDLMRAYASGASVIVANGGTGRAAVLGVTAFAAALVGAR